MSALANYNDGANFWKANPSFLFVKEFKNIHDQDKGKDGSSSFMWALSLMADGTEHNVLRNISTEERVSLVEESTGVVIDREKNKELIELYERLTMNPFERSLRSFYKKLEEREAFILGTPYDLKNASQLDNILSNTKNLHELYQKLVEDIEKFKNQSGGTTRGNAEESASEKRMM